MDSFEGRTGAALGACHMLVRQPLQGAKGEGEDQAIRRAGLVALARALSGQADELDLADLGRAARSEPMLYWACQYGIAVCCCRRQSGPLALRVIRHAPNWPEESAFHEWHRRIHEAARSAHPRQGLPSELA